MGDIVNRVGINYADNIIDPLLAFNTTQTWTVSGTGSASLDTNIFFEGVSCLKIINTDPTNDLVITNSTQTTIMPFDGNYMLSLYMRKVEAGESMTLEVKTFQNASLFNTQTFVLNEDAYGNDIDDQFQRFVANVPFNFSKSDDITFTFNLKGKVGTALLNTTIWIDGIQLEPIETSNKMPSVFKRTRELPFNYYTGWGAYEDTTYTTGSPFTASDGVKVTLPNNAGTTNESQLPIDVSTFYNGSAITGRNGDGLLLMLEFKCRPTTAASNVRLTTSIDIGGAVGEIYPRDFFLTKGSGVEHYFLRSFGSYTLDTWQLNGGTVKVLATNDDVEIYDIKYVLTRTHKAR